MSLSLRTAHERLTRMCFIDYDRQIALVATRSDPQTSRPEIVAVGRLIRLRGTHDAEVAVLVSDPFQGKGLGTEIVRQLVKIAQLEGMQQIFATMLPENKAMQQVFRELGFHISHNTHDQIVEAELGLPV
jgi:acetyltransferase